MPWIECYFANGDYHAWKVDRCPESMVAIENEVGAEYCECVSDEEFEREWRSSTSADREMPLYGSIGRGRWINVTYDVVDGKILMRVGSAGGYEGKADLMITEVIELIIALLRGVEEHLTRLTIKCK